MNEYDVFEWDAENYCTPTALERDGKSAQFGVFRLAETAAPDFDPITQAVSELPPTEIEGVWTQQWAVIDLSVEQTALNQAAKDLADAQTIANKIEALWAAADRYVTGYISGVAIGILTIGVIQSKPKAIAVTGWSSSIWAEYYARKALVTIDSVDNLDYSTFGAMPYSVPELQAEIGL